MKLPYLNDTGKKTKKYIVAFRGLNYGEGFVDGELRSSRNVSSEKYPSITQRAARAQAGQYISPTALHAKEGLVVVDGTRVLYNDTFVGTVTEGKKQIATVGNMVVIFPDKVYYNVATGEFATMEATIEAAAGTLTFTASTITTTGEDWPFKVGDAVKITGCTTAPENNKTPIIRGVSGKTLTFYDNTFTACTEEAAVTVKREVPDLDFVCENNYRLWGTKGNTIYGSAYADPLNFFVYDGLTSDSYYIDVATDGEFTGCIPYSSHVCFFKEHTLHKLYGSKPANFQIVTSQVYGVQAGSEKSMCIVNEQLLYKGVNGVYSYTGGVPELISEAFSTVRFSESVATCDGERYYISMQHNGKWGLYVYDVLRDMWLQEDDTHALGMAFSGGYVYILADDGCLYKVDRDADRKDIEWEIEFCPFSETINERKGYSEFHLRAELAAGAWLGVAMQTDQDQRWEKICTTHDRSKTISIPIVPTRCDSVSIRIYGKGECLLKTFIREFSTGSDA